MAEFDKSGSVRSPKYPKESLSWDDLTRFERGYIEAMLQPSEATHYSLTDRLAGFSDLAPETLARIISDCESFERDARAKGPCGDESQGWQQA